ncbi:MAG: DUF1501 domain-containing protein [Cyanobacteria bacterium J06642_3]
MKRRNFLTQMALGMGATLIPVGHNSLVAQDLNFSNQGRRKRLVTIFLRGAVDGLSVVVPHQEPNYYEARPRIAIPYPRNQGGAIDLDGFFGLHPELSELMPLWQQQKLAFVNCCGSVEKTRSHFEAQDYMESGVPGVKSVRDGWLNRLLGTLPKDMPTQALNVGNTTPRILQGNQAIAHLRPGKNAAKPTQVDRPEINAAFASLYQNNSDLNQAFNNGNQSRQIIREQLEQEMMAASRGAGSANKFAGSAARVARLMVSDARTQLAFMEVGGWDTHVNQKSTLDRNLANLAKGLRTLTEELGDIYKDTVILVISEFGRTVAENGNLGTDHGRGNAMWLLGGAINGGKVYGEWTGLEESELNQKRDLRITTDFREVIATVLKEHLELGDEAIAQVFPGFTRTGKITNLIA